MMAGHGRRLVAVLIADDDEEDRLLMREAFDACGLENPLYFVFDGENCLDFLGRRGSYAEPGAAPRPGIIFLDLKMPGMTGFEVVEAIKRDSQLRSIPVVVVTTSDAEEDVARSYELGVSGYVTKPVTFDGLVQAVGVLKDYWFETVALPPHGR
ncbi:MAG: response regulator [Gemmatimonadota bacterium]